MSRSPRSATGTSPTLIVRGKPVPAEIVRHALRQDQLLPRIEESDERVKYSKEHEWIRVEGDVGTVGITPYAQEQLGDVVFVDVPEVGRKVAKGKAIAVVESVKAACDIYRPRLRRGGRSQRGACRAAGRRSTPSRWARAGSSSCGSPTRAELDGLMDEAAYEAFCEGEH